MKNICPLRSMKITLLMCLLALFAHAQTPDIRAISRQQATGQPISSVLNEDGSIKRGVSGSFDPKGLRMAIGPDGSPRFVPEIEEPKRSLSPTTNCNDGWDDRFWANGPIGDVYGVAADIGGNIYVAGSFTFVGDLPVNNLAKWDGSNWSALGSGISGYYVRTIAVSGNDVYAGGDFTSAGGIPANGIAKWNGSNWSALGSGVSSNGQTGRVYAIAVSGTDVYAGGAFDTAGSTPANGIAKWNGTSWSSLGSGIGTGGSSSVSAIAALGNDVYAAGSYYDQVSGMSISVVSKWNGTWSELGSSSGNYVYFATIAVSGQDVYVGGHFTSVGGIPAENIAKWNGSSWSPLGSGISGDNGFTSAYNVTVSGTDIYAGGNFSTAGGAAVRNIAKWNGSSWSAVGSGTNGLILAIAASGPLLYLGGEFSTAGGFSANHMAKWDGSTLSAVGAEGNGLGDGIGFVGSGIVSAIAVSGSDVYVGGYFTSAGGVPTNSIAKWNGSNWSGLGAGVIFQSQTSGYVWAIVVSGTDVYAGGSFDTAGETPANNIAKWDGSTWSALGSGIGGVTYGNVRAIAVSGPDVYAGGYFDTAGETPANSIAKWNGSSWSALGSGIGGVNYPDVQAIAVSGTDVYAGGHFTSAGGLPANNIAKWNGSSWSALGSGVGGGPAIASVDTLATNGTELYVGGGFGTAGGIPGTSGIAKWNGSNWSALESGIEVSLQCNDEDLCWYVGPTEISISGSDVYVGGGTYPIYKWDGSSLSILGSGTNGSVSAIAASGAALYVGGRFSTAGCHAASNFSHYSLDFRKALFDFDGDGRSDVSVFRPSDRVWYLDRSTEGFTALQFGLPTDKIVPADYDGDGKTDVAVYRPATGVWYVLSSQNGTVAYSQLGIDEDLPAPADFDSDGRADLTVFRPSTGIWYSRHSSDNLFNSVQFGTNGDIPTVGDFDADGNADIGVYRSSDGTWYRTNSSNGSLYAEQFGNSTDLIVPADYDGDGTTDLAVYRPSDGYWYIKNSGSGTYSAFPFGLATDIPAPGDFDGDGKADLSVFRPSDGTWYRMNSVNGSFVASQFGINGDRPTEAAFRY